MQKEYLRASPSSRFAGSREFTFRHSVVRDVSYNAVPIRERKKWHAVIGAWIEDRAKGAATELAHAGHHFSAADETLRAADAYFLAAGTSLGFGFGPLGLDYRFNLGLAMKSDRLFDPVVIADANALFRRSAEAACLANDAKRDVEINATAGEVMIFYGDIIVAQRFLLRAAELAERIGETDLFVRCLSQLGRTYGHNAEFDKAFEVLRRAEARLGEEISPETACNVERCMAQVYDVMSNVDAAIEHSKRALAIALQSGLVEQKSINAHNIGDNYFEKKDYVQARQYFELSLSGVENSDFKLFAINTAFLAAIEELVGISGPGHDKLHQILQEAWEHKNVWVLSTALYLLATVHLSRGEFEEAEQQVLDCLAVGEHSHNSMYKARAEVTLERIRTEKASRK